VSKYKFDSDDSDVGFGTGKVVKEPSTDPPKEAPKEAPPVSSTLSTSTTKPKKVTTDKTFNQLVRSLYRSTMMAQQKVEELHIQNFVTKYFDEDGKPNFVSLVLPTHDNDGNTSVSVDVPLLTLAHSNYLNINELEMEFEVELGHFEDIEGDNISAKVTSISGKNVAKVRLSFNSADPPEGIAKIREELNKVLP
jgi:hypothetical protein